MRTYLYHELIYEIRIRNFNIPNIKLDFYFNDKTQEIFLHQISGEDFYLYLSQSSNSIQNITIPYYKYSVYDDMSGSLNVYVGGNWNVDKKRFICGYDMLHTKMSGKPKWYLDYDLRRTSIRVKCNVSEKTHNLFTRRRKIANILELDEVNGDKKYIDGFNDDFFFINDDDVGREYVADEHECQYYYLNDIDSHIFNWINKTVLSYIKSLPIPDLLPINKIFKEPKHQKISYKIPELYLSDVLNICGCKYSDYSDIFLYEKENFKISPSFRLVNLSTKIDNIKNRHKDIFREGFIWCVEYYDGKKRKYDNFAKPFFKISLQIANDVYVINGDNSISSDDRLESFKSIIEYNGEYEQEIFLICRNIRKNEIKILKNHEK
jgi:hypothetical protein